MTEREVKEYIEQVSTYGSILGLDSIRMLLGYMGNPQEQLKFIHIAGTNGKGSVLAYVSTILTTAGYRTGRYLSPVISEYREKIQVNGKMISKAALCEGITYIRECVTKMEAEGNPSPTLFEIETALAFWYFKKKKCDIVVLETGLGGILDATNIITNTLVAVITSISYDHMAFLGNSLTQIALAKAGIIKDDAIVVSAVQQEEAARVIEQKCAEHKCQLVVSKKPQQVKYGLKKQTFCYKERKKLSISLAGLWQPENACVAIEVCDALTQKGFVIREEQMQKGLLHTTWNGRFTLLHQKPYFVMDGAHNEDAAKRLKESIEVYFPNTPLIYIIGVLKDKEHEKILQITAKRAAHIITITPPDNPRAMQAYELAIEAREYNPNVTVADSLEEAVEMAILLAGDKCGILVFGSLSYLGRLQSIVLNKWKTIKR